MENNVFGKAGYTGWKKLLNNLDFPFEKIVLAAAAHGVNGLAYCQEFENIFNLSCRAPKKMQRKIPLSCARDN